MEGGSDGAKRLIRGLALNSSENVAFVGCGLTLSRWPKNTIPPY
jgi:hypothetical protein